MRPDELVMVVPRDVLWGSVPAFQGFAPDSEACLDVALREYLFMPRRRAESNERYKQIIPYVVIRVASANAPRSHYLMFQRAAGGDPRLGRLYSIGLGGHVNSTDVLLPPVVWPGTTAAGRRRAAQAQHAAAPAGMPAGRGAPGSPAAEGLPPGARGLVSSPARLLAAAAAAAAAAASKAAPTADESGADDRGQARRPRRLIRRITLAPELRALVGPLLGISANDHPIFRGLRRELREEVVFPAGATLRYLGAINDDGTPVGRVHIGLAFLLEVPPGPTAPRSGRRRRATRGPRAVAFRSQIRRGGRRIRVRLRREPGSVQIGALFALDDIMAYRRAMETWSVLLLDAGVLPRQPAAEAPTPG